MTTFLGMSFNHVMLVQRVPVKIWDNFCLASFALICHGQACIDKYWIYPSLETFL